MHILIVNWRDPKHPLAGGAEQSLFEHAKYWKKKGAEVTWFTSAFPKAKHKEYQDGITILRQGSQYTVHINALRFYRTLRSNPPDIIIDNFHGAPFFTPLYIQREKIIALINEPAKTVWFKNMPLPFSLAAYLAEPHFFKLYRSIPFITSAESIASELKQWGVGEDHITIIQHGVTVASNFKRSPKEKYPTIMHLSQLSPDKGIEDAIQAFGMLKKKAANAVFWIAGKPITASYEKRLHNLVRDLGLKKDITFFGFIDEKKKYDLLSRSWLLVHPSIREGWGLNVIEANYFGTPAVGYNVTGLRDSIQHKKTGLLTKKNTPQDLADTIYQMLSNKKQYTVYRENARLWARRFDWNVAGEKSWKLIKHVYGKREK